MLKSMTRDHNMFRLKHDSTRKPAMPTVFYDGQCPLCSREIAHYRGLRGADNLRWVDITRDHEALTEHGLDYETAMARFHVRDAAGIWQTGAWGFAELWSNLPAYRWLAYLLRTIRLLPLLDRVYVVFARRRRRSTCNSGTLGNTTILEAPCSKFRRTPAHETPARPGL